MAILHVTDLAVTSAKDYELEVCFDDGTRRRVRLEGLLKGCFEPLLDPERFAEVYVKPPGVPAWPTKVKPEDAPAEEAMELNLAPESLRKPLVRNSRTLKNRHNFDHDPEEQETVAA